MDLVHDAGEDILVLLSKLVGVSRVAHRWRTCAGFDSFVTDMDIDNRTDDSDLDTDMVGLKTAWVLIGWDGCQ